MFFYKNLQKKWLNFIPNGTFFTKNDNVGVFIKNKKKFTNSSLLNWTKIWFFLNYSLILLKNSIVNESNILLIADKENSSYSVKTIAKKFNFLFAVGSWESGKLTKIQWYKNIPSLIIIFRMFYPQKLYNELIITGIPNINLSTNINYKNFLSTNYNIYFSNSENILIKNVACFIAYISMKFMKKIKNSSFSIQKDFNVLFKEQLRIINYKFKIFIKKTNHFRKKNKTYTKLNFINISSFTAKNKNKNNFFTKTFLVYYRSWKFVNHKTYILQNNLKKQFYKTTTKKLNFFITKETNYLKIINLWIENQSIFKT